jgi:7-cyano-7-deazaguanine reductase
VLPDFKSLGKANSQPSKELETFPAPKGLNEVFFTSHELTANCPITGQPDIYTIQINYVPQQRCLESKSLKLYLWSFKDTRAFAESLAVQIANDVQAALEAHWVGVTLTQNVRGGLQLKVSAERHNAE